MKNVSLTSFGCVALAASFALAGCGTSSSGSPVSRGQGGASAAGAGASGNGVSGSGIITDPGTGTGGGSGTTPGQFASCATGNASASRLPVYLLFVLDGSGSMNHDNKWVAVTGAIDAIFTDMQKKADPGVGAGLIVYSDTTDPNLNTGGDYPSKVDVPISFVSQAQLGSLIKRTAPPVAPKSNTPTGRALLGAYTELTSLAPGAPLLPGGKKVVVLMTDGIPTDQGCKNSKQDGTDDYASYSCVQNAAMELAKASPDGPIETFVIGVGPLPGDFMTYDPYFLGTLALAGGTAPQGCNPKSTDAASLCYFNIDPTGATAQQTQQAFGAVLDTIRGQVASCTLAIRGSGSADIDPGQVNVVLDGMTVEQDAMNGWTYDNPQNPSSVTLHGSACGTLTNDPNATISIVLGCITVVR